MKPFFIEFKKKKKNTNENNNQFEEIFKKMGRRGKYYKSTKGFST